MSVRIVVAYILLLFSLSARGDLAEQEYFEHNDIGNLIGVVPAKNTALYFGKGGQVTTDLNFSSFLSRDFTITAWVMPQYPTGYLGPIFSNTGEGVFIVGQGDYRNGNVKFTEDKIYEGAPVFYVQVGDKKAFYLAPKWKANEWVHVAIRFLGGKFNLYVDGQHLIPKTFDASGNILNASAPEITQPDILFPNRPEGKLRFGSIAAIEGSRSKTQKKNIDVSHSSKYDIYDAQLYGLLDDVGVFDKGLSGSKIALMRHSSLRLHGYEENLLAGWGFEKPDTEDYPLPPKLAGDWTLEKAVAVNVSVDRDTQDAEYFDDWLVILKTTPTAQLPFASSEVWRVSQGYDDSDGSHSGYAAFSYDFTRVNEIGVVRTVDGGKVLCYRNDHDPAPNENREGNALHQKTSSGDYVLYLHLETDYPDYSGGVVTPKVNGFCFEPGNQPYLYANQYLGPFGDKAKHLHFSAGIAPSEGPTRPFAFGPYYASDDGGMSWYQVFKGIPKKGQHIYW